MSVGFTGTFYPKVDAKGRVSIPSAFREELVVNGTSDTEETAPPPSSRARVYVVHGPHLDDHVEAYTVKKFAQISAKISRIPRGDPMRRSMERNILRASTLLEIDDDGRTVLTKELREKIGAEGGGVLQFQGYADRFEIWLDQTATEVDGEDEWLQNKKAENPHYDLMSELDGL
ncbi:division/cell wall cluster transcriptional repressor MraZ [Histidinibacterium aquaticum]|uniref:Transcriptional regulator MraZ n=1 Tax=Histidinibacterium aquaticum TaxID=2613962 RepID=A0A5J5GNH0_9RHOB|nr:hypothetical protein [Histidinibacterium aquaticum]KAA9009839.1 hypothetical protein F3S47_00785 [Histidinibacterium aquaticum]